MDGTTTEHRPLAAGSGLAYTACLHGSASASSDADAVTLCRPPTGAHAMHPLMEAALFAVLAGALVALGAWWLR